MGEIVAVSGDHFAAAAERQGASISVWLKGNAGYEALGALETVLARVHTEAQRFEVAEAVVDLRQLKLMNYACLRAFISWITGVQELNEQRRYRVRLQVNPALYWQRRGLPALCGGFATDLVSITDEPA